MEASSARLNSQGKCGYFPIQEVCISGSWLDYPKQKGEVLPALCDRVDKKMNQLCTAAFVMRKALLFCQSISFSKVEVECNFAELVELLNSDRICSLEVAWTPEDISCIRESFVFISFFSIPLQYNHAALALVSDVKEEERPLFG